MSEIIYMRTRFYDEEEVNSSIIIWNEETLVFEDIFGCDEATQLNINIALRHKHLVRIMEINDEQIKSM